MVVPDGARCCWTRPARVLLCLESSQLLTIVSACWKAECPAPLVCAEQREVGEISPSGQIATRDSCVIVALQGFGSLSTSRFYFSHSYGKWLKVENTQRPGKQNHVMCFQCSRSATMHKQPSLVKLFRLSAHSSAYSFRPLLLLLPCALVFKNRPCWADHFPAAPGFVR